MGWIEHFILIIMMSELGFGYRIFGNRPNQMGLRGSNRMSSLYSPRRSVEQESTGKCDERSGIVYKDRKNAVVDVRFPSISTTEDDTYLCTAYKIPFENQESFIVKFIPHADMEQTHHMLVYGCKNVDTKKPWMCSRPCSDAVTLYAWARNAPEMKLPDDVGYSIGKGTKIQYIAVQMHFAKAFSDESCSGVSAVVTTTPQKYLAGIYLFGAFNIYLPPHSTNVLTKITCKNSVTSPMHVFAFRTHAHTLANVITGYRYRDKTYKMIGKGNPKWPQSFYPRVGGEMTLLPGDVLMAECTYNNTRDVAVAAGPTGSDEMCNLYLMFYTTDKHVNEQNLECWGDHVKKIGFPSSVSEMAPYPGFAGQDSMTAIAAGLAQKPSVPDEHMHHHHHSDDHEEEHASSDAKTQVLSNKETSEDDANEARPLTDEEISDELERLKKFGVDGATKTNKTRSRGHGMPEYMGLQVDFAYPHLQQEYQIGQVGGLVGAPDGSVYIFHRADRTWTGSSFDSKNRFTQPNNPIMKDTVYHLDKDRGRVLHSWGRGQFFMPHGASLDHEGNIWLTDVALHQVLKYPPLGAKEPLLSLGVRMVPGSDIHHFCKPTDVAIDADGTIFVSDGYCNGRVIKFSPDGTYITQWGHMVTSKELSSTKVPPYAFFIAHNIILCGPERDEICVADRENGRIQCFTKGGGLTRIIEDKAKTGTTIYAITYSPLEGGVIFGVNGPGTLTKETAGGFTINYSNGMVVDRWQPSYDLALTMPHDISATPDGKEVFVGELSEKKLFKFRQLPSSNTESSKDIESDNEKEKQQLNDKISELKEEDIDEKKSAVSSDEPLPTENKKDNADDSNSLRDSKAVIVEEKTLDPNVNSASAATIIIVCLVALPVLAVLGSMICIRMRAKRLKEYESLLSPNGKSGSGKALNIGKFLKPAERKGFKRVSTDDTDYEDDDSDVEVYSKNEIMEESTELQSSTVDE